jgi:hypothetical protein
MLLFCQWLLKCQQKKVFFTFLCSLLTAGTFTTVCKDSKSFRSNKTVEIKFFLDFLLVGEKIRIRILEAQNLRGHTDPEHFLFIFFGLIQFLLFCTDSVIPGPEGAMRGVPGEQEAPPPRYGPLPVEKGTLCLSL